MDDDFENGYIQDKDIHDLVGNKEVCRRTAEKFLNRIIDELALGLMFDAHRKHYSRVFDLDRDTLPGETENVPSHLDIFGNYNMKKTQECVCPNCDRPVAAQRFAPHLEKCMGMGRNRGRNVRRVASNNKERESTSYSGMGSDDEDDADWNSGEKRSRKKKDRNGNKKGKGTPKKVNEAAETADAIDIEGEEDSDLVSLRDILQDHSNGSSPSDSSSSTKRREKSKSKKSKRDRTSPGVTFLNAD